MDLEIQYIFRFDNGQQTSFPIRLDADRVEGITADALPPEWTRLEFHRCANCPLDAQATPWCPLARALVGTVELLGNVLSYHDVEVEALTPERRITHKTSAQNGISAMMGLIIATSGCPHTAYFKPMARFHLPFATEEETMYRAASMYLLGQFFRQQQGLPTELGFEGLLKIYRNMELVNRAMANRLRAAAREDGTVNALVLLDMYAKTLPVVVEDALEELRPLYTAYLETPPQNQQQ